MVWGKSGALTWQQKRSTMHQTRATALPRVLPDGVSPDWVRARIGSGPSCRPRTPRPVSPSWEKIQRTLACSRASSAERSLSGGCGRARATWPFSRRSPTALVSLCWFHADLWPLTSSDWRRETTRGWSLPAGRCRDSWRPVWVPGEQASSLRASRSTTLTPSWSRCSRRLHPRAQVHLRSFNPLTLDTWPRRMDPRPTWKICKICKAKLQRLSVPFSSTASSERLWLRFW